MKKLIIGSTVCVVLILALITYNLFNTDERRIEKNLRTLAKTVSKSEDDGIFTLSGKIDTLNALFTQDCTIDVGKPARKIRRRSNLVDMYTRAFGYIKTLEVKLYDITITIAEDRLSATAAMTVTARGPDIEGMDAREIEIAWKNIDDKWMIAEVKEIETLK